MPTPKPAVAHPNLKPNKIGLTLRDYEGAPSTLCAGCGHDSITAAIVEACWMKYGRARRNRLWAPQADGTLP